MKDSTKTLGYASAFIFNKDYPQKFMIGKKVYQYVNTVYDRRDVDGGYNTIVVVYDYKAQKYEAFNLSDEKLSNKEIVIL